VQRVQGVRSTATGVYSGCGRAQGHEVGADVHRGMKWMWKVTGL